DIIFQYIFEELALGRFMGPFHKDELESKISPSCSSPIQVVVKLGSPGKPDKFWCC
ncbi:hypothetical protein HYPSUDRAFT_102178, partial [Hypholoma sublateritium FD-334 SS-4]